MEQFVAARQMEAFSLKQDADASEGDDSVRKDTDSLQFSATVAFSSMEDDYSKSSKGLEARVGIEPTHKGFADLSLTTWVPRLGRASLFCGSFQTAVANPAGAGGRNGAGDEI
jgi:hypothetical protein